ncbi:putative PRE10-20S proteasome subunit C1 [Microstroma glucosiphilum]|uniref:Proteasome subunit alpha type n=1 Tax=Pseudomicrostroma glucosiphilum TaxID=1684307 RepID=A0A316UBX2_9BASI|nr:putative PRE10-20S proteasome subunit C1 [Pseudomicrostroma glucosiphilum]PWN22669.1 putative PRE10-20S proteasome subunit C1 [Pseudomicrostroma glucosiphilum]
MASQGTGYDLSASTYSPDGRIFQIEYAQKAVENAGTVIGIKCKDGIVLAVEKLVNTKLLVKGTNRRILNIDRHAGFATAGLIADGYHLADRARQEAVNFRDTYKFPAPIGTLARRLSSYIHAFTLYSSVRPFGISTLLFGIDEIEGPQIYLIEPSGTYWGYKGAALGKARQLAKTEIEKLDLSELSLEDGVKEAAKIIYKVHDDAKDKDFELEMAWIGPQTKGGKGQVELVPQDKIDEAARLAKEAMDNEMED